MSEYKRAVLDFADLAERAKALLVARDPKDAKKLHDWIVTKDAWGALGDTLRDFFTEQSAAVDSFEVNVRAVVGASNNPYETKEFKTEVYRGMTGAQLSAQLARELKVPEIRFDRLALGFAHDVAPTDRIYDMVAADPDKEVRVYYHSFTTQEETIRNLDGTYRKYTPPYVFYVFDPVAGRTVGVNASASDTVGTVAAKWKMTGLKVDGTQLDNSLLVLDTLRNWPVKIQSLVFVA